MDWPEGRDFAEVMQRSLKMASTGDVVSKKTFNLAHQGKRKDARYNMGASKMYLNWVKLEKHKHTGGEEQQTIRVVDMFKVVWSDWDCFSFGLDMN